MMKAIPMTFSRRVKKVANIRMAIVMGMATTVSPNSIGSMFVTITRNCTVKLRKKKKSNFKRVM